MFQGAKPEISQRWSLPSIAGIKLEGKVRPVTHRRGYVPFLFQLLSTSAPVSAPHHDPLKSPAVRTNRVRGDRVFPHANQSREGRSHIPAVRTNRVRGDRVFPQCEPIA
eukprot:1195133-Prorocentrum_minimum.AAC.2